MYKNIILVTFLIILTSCSQTKAKKEVKIKKEVEVKTVVEHNKTITPTTPTTIYPNNEVSSDFVPRHIRLSHIEVVPH